MKNEHLGEIKDFSQNFGAFLFINEGFFRFSSIHFRVNFVVCCMPDSVHSKLEVGRYMLVTQGLYTYVGNQRLITDDKFATYLTKERFVS